MSYVSPTTGTTELTPEISGWYKTVLLKELEPRLVHCAYGESENMPKMQGKTMTMRRYTRLTDATTALPEGVTPAGQQMAKTDIVATVAQYGDYVLLTDWVVLTGRDKHITKAKMLLGKQSGKTHDSLCRNVLVAGDNVRYSNGSARTDVNTPLAVDDMKYISNYFKRNDVERRTKRVAPSSKYGTAGFDPAYICIVHEDAEFDLAGMVGYVPIAEYSSHKNTLPGEVGAWGSIRFVASSNAKIFTDGGAAKGTMRSTTGTSADVYAAIFLGEDAFTQIRIGKKSIESIVKGFGSAGANDPLNQRATAGWKSNYVAKITNETCVYRLEHAVTAL